MSTLVPCYLKPQVASELKRLAVLAGSESAAVERLIEFWTANRTASPRPGDEASDEMSPPATAMWRSSKGDELPVGARLEATYKGRNYHATVEQDGIRFGKSVYRSPSAAGRAVKSSAGVTGAASQTDGRSFWSVRHPTTGRLVTIGELNPRSLIDPEELLRELSESGVRNATIARKTSAK